MFCKNCGTELNDTDAYCSKCGRKVSSEIIQNTNPAISAKSRLVATLLAWFFGVFGAHRFYVGRIGSAVAMLFTIGGLGIWAFIDLIVLICGEFKDCNGLKIKIWCNG